MKNYFRMLQVFGILSKICETNNCMKSVLLQVYKKYETFEVLNKTFASKYLLSLYVNADNNKFPKCCLKFFVWQTKV